MPDKRILTGVLVFALLLGEMSGLPAQQKFLMTIDNLMRGPGLYGYEPTGVRWSGDGREIYFLWKQAADAIDHPLDTYVVNRDGSGLRKLSDEESKLAPPPAGNHTRDRKRTVYSLDGDIFIYDFSTGARTQLTKTEDNETNPAFTHDEQHVAFTRGGNLYVMALATGMIEQMTDIVAPGATPPTAPSGFGRGRGGRGGGAQSNAAAGEKKGTDSQEFLKKQEQELIEAVRERTRLREENEAKRKKEHPRKPFQLQQRQSAARLDLCPDEKCVIAMINESSSDAKPQNVPSYVNESAYPEDIVGRTDVGDAQNRVRMAILDVATGDAKWVEPDVQGRDIQLQPPLWNEAGTEAVMVARATDNKDRWILAL
ncbi:MAG TPA: DPP IV N-terminal domain-containing protein, partial [Bryobacteraceae bacterium]|nr:DPP IV N-terminal domain-containing protein [Bryobacteraceae bacterium]